MNRKEIIEYQELSSNAWPAKRYLFLHGWILRLSEGVTKRANSVLPLRYEGDDLPKDISCVEEIYKTMELPVIFQLPDYFEPETLQETLLSLEYAPIDESLVMNANIEDITADAGCRCSIKTNGSDKWFEALAAFSNHSKRSAEGQKAIIQRISLSKAFCYAEKDNRIVGIGLGVIERHYMGIYSLVVHPDYRRKGVGQSMIAEMVKWAKSRAVIQVYLQVQGDNAAAISLYCKIGFRECYHYRYFIR